MNLVWLKLIKRIVEVNGEKVPERIQKVDVSKLNTRDENGKLITTGDYTLDKTVKISTISKFLSDNGKQTFNIKEVLDIYEKNN